MYKCNQISVPEVVGIRARTRHSTVGRDERLDGVSRAEGRRGDELPKENRPGPWDGKMIGDGGTERLDKDSWLSDSGGLNRCDLSQCAMAEWAEGGVAGTLDTGVVMMSNASTLGTHSFGSCITKAALIPRNPRILLKILLKSDIAPAAIQQKYEKVMNRNEVQPALEIRNVPHEPRKDQ